MTTKFLLTILALLISAGAFSQSVGINSDGSTPDKSAILDISSVNQGLLIPRVTLSGVNDAATIASPATSLLVYNLANSSGLTTGFYYNSGTKKEVRGYSKGKKEGIWKTWNEAGVQTAEAGFKNGLKDGNWFIWDDTGVKRYEMFYEKGEKKGLWIIRDENGKEVSRDEFK